MVVSHKAKKKQLLSKQNIIYVVYLAVILIWLLTNLVFAKLTVRHYQAIYTASMGFSP